MKRKLALLLTLLLTLSLVNFIPAAASAEVYVEEYGDLILTYYNRDFDISYNSLTKTLELKSTSEYSSYCEIAMKEGARVKPTIKIIGQFTLTLNDILLNDLIVGANSTANLYFKGENTIECKIIGTVESVNVVLDGESGSSLDVKGIKLAGSLTVMGGDTKVNDHVTCSSLAMQRGKLHVKGKYSDSGSAVHSDSIRFSGGDLTVKRNSNDITSLFSTEPILECSYCWNASNSYALSDDLTDGSITPFTNSKEYKVVRLMSKDSLVDISGEGIEGGGGNSLYIGNGAKVNLSMPSGQNISAPFGMRVGSTRIKPALATATSLRIEFLDKDTSCVDVFGNSVFYMELVETNTFTGNFAGDTAVIKLETDSTLTLGSGATLTIDGTAENKSAAPQPLGSLEINALSAGFDGTGKLVLNNLPLTITSEEGKAFGSLTDIELNYPDGYMWKASKTSTTDPGGAYFSSAAKPFVLDDYKFFVIIPMGTVALESADGYIFRTYEDWLREQAEKDLMAPPSGLQPDPTTEPEDLFAD